MKSLFTSAIVALIVSVVALGAAIPQVQEVSPDTNLGGIYNTVLQRFDGGITVGPTGSTLGQIIDGTCNLVGGAIAATSSAPADCAVTGVKPGDLVFATLGSTTASAVITNARASTTAGYITVRILNLTGGASSVSALGTSTPYLIIR